MAQPQPGHLDRAVELLELLDSHLELAKDDHEAPWQVVQFLQTSLRDVRMICQHHAQRGPRT